MDEALAQGSIWADETYGRIRTVSHDCAHILKTSWADVVLRWHTDEPCFGIILALVVLASVVVLVTCWWKQRGNAGRPSTPTIPQREKREAREFGKWSPSDFQMPTPEPYKDWSIEHTKPLPYRPFRYGPKYFVNMGLRSLKHEDWIELDNHFPRFHADKAERIAERGSNLCKTAPEAYPAAIELLEELREYLPARYPSLFKRTEVGLDNLWSGESFDLTARPLSEDPMQICARLVQDDIAIMIEKPDGNYYFLAGCIVLPGFWRLKDKFGMPLSEIHTSGGVPQYKEKLEKGMMSLFRRLKPADIVGRFNYAVQTDDNLGWSRSMAPEDSDLTQHEGWTVANKSQSVDEHYFRCERQTLRRLPKTGGIVFTIRTYFHPLKEIADEDYVPGRLASAVRSWGEDISQYKGKDKFAGVLLEYLDKKHEEQIARGLDLSREDEVRAYPW